jgi:hypothetical protein
MLCKNDEVKVLLFFMEHLNGLHPEKKKGKERERRKGDEFGWT